MLENDNKSIIKKRLRVGAIVIVLALGGLRCRGYYIPFVSNGTKASFHLSQIDWYASTDFFDQEKRDFHWRQFEKCDCVDIVNASLDLYLREGCNPRSTLRPLSLFRLCESPEATSELKKHFEKAVNDKTKLLTGIALFHRTGDIQILNQIVDIPLDEFNKVWGRSQLHCFSFVIKDQFEDAPEIVFVQRSDSTSFSEQFLEWVKHEASKSASDQVL